MLGAKIIEKHLTLNNKLKGPDHSSSLNPENFKKMVISIRKVEQMIKYNSSLMSKGEKNKRIVRKSIVAKKKYKKRRKNFLKINITVKRPGSGIDPIHWFEVLKKKSPKNFKKR